MNGGNRNGGHRQLHFVEYKHSALVIIEMYIHVSSHNCVKKPELKCYSNMIKQCMVLPFGENKCLCNLM